MTEEQYSSVHIDRATGEISPHKPAPKLKPYQTEKHHGIKSEIAWQMQYIGETLGSPDDKSRFAALDANLLSLALGELTAMYTGLSKWLADEKLHLNDLKAHYDVMYANSYLDYKEEGETNETARMRARVACQSIKDEINKYTHGYDVIEAWKKSIGRWHETVRSQLSYEKQQEIMGRGVN